MGRSEELSLIRAALANLERVISAAGGRPTVTRQMLLSLRGAAPDPRRVEAVDHIRAALDDIGDKAEYLSEL